MKIGVTGANGFVGTHLIKKLETEGHDVTALVRDKGTIAVPTDASVVEIPTLDGQVEITTLSEQLRGLDALIHLAGHVHKMSADGRETAFHDVNVLGSARLFEAANDAGISRFVFLSSVKAAGERSGAAPLTLENSPGPEDAYGRSKRDAEQKLQALAVDANCHLTILRATFVYGWPAVGNFKSVINAVQKGVPLPLNSIQNRRHMVYVGNLVDALWRASTSNTLSSTPYFVADDEPVSTPDLFRQTGNAFGTPAKLFPMPVWILRLAGALTGRRNVIARLTENLEVDTRPFRRDADWMAPYNMSEGLMMCADNHAQSMRDGKRQT